MRTLDVKEAEDQLLELLDDVAQGETIVITKEGVPVARLEPLSANPQVTPTDAFEQWERYREEHNIRLDGLSIRAMIDEGRM